MVHKTMNDLKTYRSIGAYKETGEAVRIYALKCNINIADLLERIVNEYGDNHPEFKNFVKTFKTIDVDDKPSKDCKEVE
jgi:hypothetical protein